MSHMKDKHNTTFTPPAQAAIRPSSAPLLNEKPEAKRTRQGAAPPPEDFLCSDSEEDEDNDFGDSSPECLAEGEDLSDSLEREQTQNDSDTSDPGESDNA